MKNIELFSINSSLNELDLAKKLPVKIGFKIVKNTKKIEELLTSYIEMKNKIIEKYANENGEVTVDNPDYKVCSAELSELDMIDNDVAFDTVKISDIENIELSLKDINALYFMVEE